MCKISAKNIKLYGSWRSTFSIFQTKNLVSRRSVLISVLDLSHLNEEDNELCRITRFWAVQIGHFKPKNDATS